MSGSDEAPNTESGETEHAAPTYVKPGEGLDQYVTENGALSLARAQAMQEEINSRPTVGDGGFKLDLDAMKALLPRWKQVEDKLGELIDDGHTVDYVLDPPAEDYASKGEISAAWDHSSVYNKIINQQHQYAQAYIKALENAIAGYEETERAAGDGARDAGQGL